jgi:hypothetical protein
VQGRLHLFGSSIARVLIAAGLALAVLMWLGPLSTEARQAAGKRAAPFSPTLTFLPCINKAGDKYRAKVEPKRCAHFGARGAFAGGVELKNLVWTNWGEARTTAIGVECGFHLPCAQTAVKVQAFRVRKACGRRIYTRLKAVSEFGKTLVKTRACLGPA